MKKIKEIFIEAVEENRKRKDELARIEKEKKEEETRKEEERTQNQIKAIIEMSDKEMMAKVILELMSLNARLSQIEKIQKESENILNSLDSKVLMINISIDEIKYK